MVCPRFSGPMGFEKILFASVALHGESALEAEICVDTTGQEKNTTFPTDAKQYRKKAATCGQTPEDDFGAIITGNTASNE
ncbi:hypothetical protein MNBD_GAMMA24-1465 [hydrothermal vent metagenome]|uniref:Uncharacterized protein n=1 Tax=hydrothermal vent metagenome TaxID=652676 RepID=A0A3B1BD35_9ZZZZ